jgi:hypothetical protein
VAFGQLEGVGVSAAFSDRGQLLEAGVHRQNQAGIAGSAEGAESIVLG